MSEAGELCEREHSGHADFLRSADGSQEDDEGEKHAEADESRDHAAEEDSAGASEESCWRLSKAVSVAIHEVRPTRNRFLNIRPLREQMKVVPGCEAKTGWLKKSQKILDVTT